MPRNPGHTETDFLRQHRQDRLIQERVHDPYKTRTKYQEPTVCPTCNAVFQTGRWQWLAPPEQAHQHLCPACSRVRDRVPGSFLTMSGEFFSAHKQEIMNLVQNYETRQKAEHPMKRIMDVTEIDGQTVVTFTDQHLARGIGDALFSAYDGELDFSYQQEESMIRVYWKR